MTKLLKIEIKDFCNSCPYFKRDYDFDSDICYHMVGKEIGEIVETYRIIPSWCPLPEKKE